MKTVAAIDFETTGMDPRKDHVIEGAVILVGIDDGKSLGTELDSYASMNDPGIPIPQEIIELTGITDDMVRGQKLDWNRFNSILERADLIIAHNTRFDRGWAELYGKFLPKSERPVVWGCSLAMVDWKKTHRMPCGTLRHLAWEHGHFPNSHRALDDVRTMLQLLRNPARGRPSETYFEELLRNAVTGKRLVLARGAAFEKKDLLKGNQFSWSGAQRVWWRLVPEPEWEQLKTWLDQEIYNGRPLHQSTPQVDFLAADFRTKYGLE